MKTKTKIIFALLGFVIFLGSVFFASNPGLFKGFFSDFGAFQIINPGALPQSTYYQITPGLLTKSNRSPIGNISSRMPVIVGRWDLSAQNTFTISNMCIDFHGEDPSSRRANQLEANHVRNIRVLGSLRNRESPLYSSRATGDFFNGACEYFSIEPFTVYQNDVITFVLEAEFFPDVFGSIPFTPLLGISGITPATVPANQMAFVQGRLSVTGAPGEPLMSDFYYDASRQNVFNFLAEALYEDIQLTEIKLRIVPEALQPSEDIGAAREFSGIQQRIRRPLLNIEFTDEAGFRIANHSPQAEGDIVLSVPPATVALPENPDTVVSSSRQKSFSIYARSRPSQTGASIPENNSLFRIQLLEIKGVGTQSGVLITLSPQNFYSRSNRIIHEPPLTSESNLNRELNPERPF